MTKKSRQSLTSDTATLTCKWSPSLDSPEQLDCLLHWFLDCLGGREGLDGEKKVNIFEYEMPVTFAKI